MFLEFKNNIWKLQDEFWTHGWAVMWENFLELLDPFGEQHALKASINI